MGIYVNQLGYKPNEKKIVITTKPGEYILKKLDDNKEVICKTAVFVGNDKLSGDDVWHIDFTECDIVGKYEVISKDKENSVTFDIKDDVYNELHNGALKVLHYQRCGCELKKEHVGVYNHAACHTEPSVLLDDYIYGNKDAVKYDITGGWHDAGDFGRYSTPAAVAVGHLLYAFEMFPDSFKESLNIPETGNGIPDVLNECRYELDWLLKMQTKDGGVYHKLTSWKHADFIMPEYDDLQFILYPFSSMAVADFVAVMALASRVYRKYDEKFANKALEAARLSFKWLLNNPYIGFTNPEGSNTGNYSDASDEDERMWAAAEMLRTDTDGDVASYKEMLSKYVFSDIAKTDMGWTDVAGFTLFAVLTDPNKTAGDDIINELKNAMFKEVDRLLLVEKQTGYLISMEYDDFVWGSNMVVCNRGMLFILASILCTDEAKANEYKEASYNLLHYLLGRNALDRSYVTGFGQNAYKNPHNRTSACDDIDEPMKGWVSGGPFKTPADPAAIKMIPKGTCPMKCHADDVGSYSTNEITIYWNSPLVFMTAYLK